MLPMLGWLVAAWLLVLLILRRRGDTLRRRSSALLIRRQRELLDSIISSIANPFYVIDVRDYTVTLTNAGRCSPQDNPTCYNVSHNRITPCPEGAGHPCPVEIVKRTKNAVTVEHVHYDRDGNPRYFEVHGAPVLDERGDVTHVIEYSVDITERRRMEEMLRSLSLVDELTGLYNRRGFTSLAEKQLAVAARTGARPALFFIDVDDFKRINDSFGHHEGDLALVEVNAVLRQTFRESDIIGRFGGDEFVVFSLMEAGGEGIDAVAGRLQRNLAARNRERAAGYDLEVSVGSVLCHAADGEPCGLSSLIHLADTLMYEQKTAKKLPRRGEGPPEPRQ